LRAHGESLWLWDGESSRTQKGERPSSEVGTRGVVKMTADREDQVRMQCTADGLCEIAIAHCT
jgi:hypothetical protein